MTKRNYVTDVTVVCLLTERHGAIVIVISRLSVSICFHYDTCMHAELQVVVMMMMMHAPHSANSYLSFRVVSCGILFTTG